MAVGEIKTSPPTELHNGDFMNREEFHRLYEQTPADFKAELIRGIVYVASPMRRSHGMHHLPLGTLFYVYESRTPGVEAGDNSTVLLGEWYEPQPDLLLRVTEECGGTSRVDERDYIEGPPELTAEIAHSSRAIDLHTKKHDYAEHGVLEYLVLDVADRELHWFDLQDDVELQPDDDGVIRVKSFPGLWIDPAALVDRNASGLLATLERGLNSPQHAEFVGKLQAHRRSQSDS